ncbi:Uncharacterised protein [Mycobacterium tuberculosis]|uniref:Uncharacterized protein n=1 Tax=Mycobacterium tuberculosis TaxID=1773 RepID=A0A655ETH8_MYCTX|nr:Uncharacterised protein [Mycobacterium tuberculosis]
MRSQTDVSLTQAARHSVTGDPHAIVGHIQNAFFVGDSEPDRGGGSSGMPHDVGQQFANHTENDGVDPTTYWVINIGGDLDTRTLSGRGRQLFYRRPQPNLLKHCRMQLEGGLPQPLRRALQSGQRASDALVAGGYGIQLDELLTRGQHVLQRSIVNGFRNPPLQHLRGRHRLGKQFRPQRTQAGNRTGMPLLDANHHQGRGAQERIEREPKYCLGPSNRAQHHGVSQHRDCESD